MLLLVPGLLLFRLHACRYLGQEKTVGAASRVDAVDRHDVTASSVVAAKCEDIAGADLKDYPSHWKRSFTKQQWTIEPLASWKLP